MTVQAAAVRGQGQRNFPWLALVVLASALALFIGIVAEVGLRLAELRASNLAGLQCVGSRTLLHGQKGLYVLSAAAGYEMRPDTCVRLRSAEYDGVLRTNSQGMVGPELSTSKPVGEYRIVMLGDSYGVGGQVPYEQTFPAVLEQRLREAGYPSVRVINAAVGGYTTFNEAGLLRHRLPLLQPDLVVVAAFVGNDVSENVLATAAGYRDAPEHPKGVTWGQDGARLVADSGRWFVRNALGPATLPAPWDPGSPLPTATTAKADFPGARAVTQTPTSSPAQSVKAAARAAWDGARATSLLLGRLFGVPIDSSVTTAPGAQPLAVEQKKLNLTSFEWTILRDIPRTYWLDVAWPLFGEYLSEIRATASPAPVVLVAIPEMAQFDEQMHARTMYEFRFTDDEVAWDRPQQELAVQAARANVPLLDLLPLFRGRSDRAELYLRQDTHFTALGHRVTADALAAFVRGGGWLPAR